MTAIAGAGTTAIADALITPPSVPGRSPSQLRGSIGRWIILAVAAIYFIGPLLVAFLFTIQNHNTNVTTHKRIGGAISLKAYTSIFAKPETGQEGFGTAFKMSIILSVFTILLTLAVLLPTMLLIHLRLQKVRPVVEILTLLPLVFPPIVLVVGVQDSLFWTKANFHGWSVSFINKDLLSSNVPLILVFLYMMLSMPFVFRSLDAGIRSIDSKTLVEASRNLGAGWLTTLVPRPDPVPAHLHRQRDVPVFRAGHGRIHDRQHPAVQAVPGLAGHAADHLGTGPGRYLGAEPLHRRSAVVDHWCAERAPYLEREGLIHDDSWGNDGNIASLRSRRIDKIEGTVVEYRNVHRVYGTVHALDGLDLTIAPGEMLALLGPSGCGKTTALRMLAGFDHPTTGQVLVGGKDISRVAVNKRDMGMVFQSYSLFPTMKAIDNVGFGLRLRKQSASQRKARARELLDLVGLSAHEDKFPHQMSGGQQQRVALARALAISPRVLLLDEPLSALDAKVREQLREEIRRIQLELGVTTVFVTHDQEEAFSVADRVGVMRLGKLEQCAAPAELYDRPITAFVAEFIGSMNHLDGIVEEGGQVRVGPAAAAGRRRGPSGRQLGAGVGPTGSGGGDGRRAGRLRGHDRDLPRVVRASAADSHGRGDVAS